MSQRHHARQPSQGRKVLPPHARPSKPPPLTSRKSYNHAHAHSHSHSTSHAHAHAHPSPNKAHGPGWGKKGGAEDAGVQASEDEASGMESFLQFCPTCEKQIITPQASLLYCSEACRRRDSRPASQESIHAVVQTMHLPSAANHPWITSQFDQPVPDIVPQRSPTVLRPMSIAFSEFSTSDSDSSRRDSRQDADARNYLEEFYSDLSNARASRPRMSRANTAGTGGDSSTNLPSLVHSPSSSYGTVASNASCRPIVPRHTPFSSTHSTNKSIDLVIPHPTASGGSPTQLLKDASLKSSASTLTSFKVAEANDITYEKWPTSRRDSRNSSKTDQSLKQLFSHEAMKAPPKQ